MKKLILLSFIALITSCGYQRSMDELREKTDKTNTEVDILKNKVSALESSMSSAQAQLAVLDASLSSQGAAVTSQIAAINDSITNLNASQTATQAQLDALSTLVTSTINDVAVLSGKVDALETADIGLQLSIDALQSDLNTLNALVANYVNLGTNAYNQIQSQFADVASSLTTINTYASSLQSQINSSLVQLATIQGYDNIVAIVDPCGAQGSFDEVFLQLNNGQLLASISETANGKNTRFSLLTDGSFVTTDSTNCHFTLSNGGTTISDEHN